MEVGNATQVITVKAGCSYATATAWQKGSSGWKAQFSTSAGRVDNQMHTTEGADFPFTESGERGSGHLINHPTRYAKALVIDFNRWPAVPGRGAGIFLHVHGSGATAGCVSVPRATMDRFMGWVEPSANPRIAIG
ncbi:L,D-transpeptidase family protein [Streptomyces sp. SJL17-1]|uniref:L,D-transpeptidase family protein n=1 Tax=Streptomyces sp. SJL17-1 TaxID=2967223 RepID=UPI00399035F3